MPTLMRDDIVKNDRISRDRPVAGYIPADFDDLFRNYYVYTIRLVHKAGIQHKNAEDVASTILMKAFEHGLLADYDPERLTNGRRASFHTFLGGFVLKYVRHYRERQAIGIEREGQSTDVEIEVPDGRGGEEPTTWIEEHGPTMEESYDDLYADDFMTTARAHLRTVSLGRKDSQLDLVVFFNIVSAQVEAEGEIITSDLMEHFEVSRTTIHNWMARLRTEMAKVVEYSR